MCDFHNKEKSSQDILMLAKHTHINCTSYCCFLDHNPATGSFQAIVAEISFVGSLTSFKSSWSTCIVVLSLSDSSLHCFHYLKKCDKGFGLFSAIIKVFYSHGLLEVESKMAPTLEQVLLLAFIWPIACPRRRRLHLPFPHLRLKLGIFSLNGKLTHL